MHYQQQHRPTIQQCPRVPPRSVTASDDTWRIEMKCGSDSYALLFTYSAETNAVRQAGSIVMAYR